MNIETNELLLVFVIGFISGVFVTIAMASIYVMWGMAGLF